LLQNYIRSNTSAHGKHGNRYPAPVKALFFVTLNRGGTGLFNFWSDILCGPSLETMRRCIREENADLGITFAAAQSAFNYFKSFGYDPSQLPTHIAYDATKLQPAFSTVEDSQDNCCYIIGGDCKSVGLKVKFDKQADGEALVGSNKPADYVYVFLVCALSPDAPSVYRVVGVLPTNLRFAAADLADWLASVRRNLERAGFNHIISQGSDGDGRHRKVALGLMQKQSTAGFVACDELEDIAPGMRSILTLYARKFVGSSCYTMHPSDATHWVKKWSLCFLSMSRLLLLGNFPVLVTSLAMVHSLCPDAGLKARDVNGVDKMDYDSAKRRLNFTVREHLAGQYGQQGLCAYLAIGDCVDTAMFDKVIDMTLRWRLMCRAAIFLRYWYAWHKASEINSMHFIPLQLFTDFFLIFHTFVFKLILHRDVYESVPYVPALDGSDQDECFFSIMREMDEKFDLKRFLKLVQKFHAEMSMRVDSESRGVVPPYVTKRGHNKSIYMPSTATHTPPNQYPTDAAMLQLYKEEVEESVKPLLAQLGMDVLLKKAGQWDNPPLECLKQVQVDMHADEDDSDGDMESVAFDDDIGNMVDFDTDSSSDDGIVVVV
jgi:hypothetical protein